MHYIYKITNKITNEVYVGSTTLIPSTRWSQHISTANANTHSSEKFQICWNNFGITDWVFEVIECVDISKRKLKRIEAGYILDIPCELRLNMPTGTMISEEKHRAIIDCIKNGEKYILISEKLKVSLGTISNIKKEFEEEYGSF